MTFNDILLFTCPSKCNLLHTFKHTWHSHRIPVEYTKLLPLLCRAQVLGEYSYLSEELEPATVLRLLAKLLDTKTTSSETKSWVLMAMTKLCEGGTGVSVAREVSETYSSSLDTVLRQRAQELQHLSQDSELRARVLPRDAVLEPLEVTYVHAGLQNYNNDKCTVYCHCNVSNPYNWRHGNISFDFQDSAVETCHTLV